jgi:hypothetical protein
LNVNVSYITIWEGKSPVSRGRDKNFGNWACAL